MCPNLVAVPCLIFFLMCPTKSLCCDNKCFKMGKIEAKTSKEETRKEGLMPPLEKRQALDFLFAAICLVLLREINSPRHTDQYSLNPHLIWQEFPPISPSLPPQPLSLLFYSPSPLVFSNHFRVTAIFHATGLSRWHRRECCFLTQAEAACARLHARWGRGWWIWCVGPPPPPPRTLQR